MDPNHAAPNPISFPACSMHGLMRPRIRHPTQCKINRSHPIVLSESHGTIDAKQQATETVVFSQQTVARHSNGSLETLWPIWVSAPDWVLHLRISASGTALPNKPHIGGSLKGRPHNCPISPSFRLVRICRGWLLYH